MKLVKDAAHTFCSLGESDGRVCLARELINLFSWSERLNTVRVGAYLHDGK